MPKVIKLKKGLDLRLTGEADRRTVALPMAQAYAVTPSDFEGLVPKLLVQPGDGVKAGTPLMFSKSDPRVVFTSPVSGTVAEVRRGEKRRILEIVVTPDDAQAYERFATGGFRSMERAQLVDLMLGSGLWPFVMQRPYGIIANPDDQPKAIFISGFDSAPLAPDLDYILDGEGENLAAGIDVLNKLTPGKVHLSLRASKQGGVLDCVAGVEKHLFEGPHPAGNVGVQVHHIDPVNKGEKVWTVDAQAVALIGRFFNKGAVDMTRTVALTGSELGRTHYVTVIAGARMDSLVGGVDPVHSRIVCGNVLTGRATAREGFLNFYCNQVTVIPEGNHYEFLGWAMPRFDKFSVSRSYFSWLAPRKRYTLDTNLNGGRRAFVFTGLYDRYLPMDIYPMYLLKAILAGDIDKMENLGIYEVVEEDFALCEFVDPSKTEMQQIVRDGINLMIKEL